MKLWWLLALNIIKVIDLFNIIEVIGLFNIIEIIYWGLFLWTLPCWWVHPCSGRLPGRSSSFRCHCYPGTVTLPHRWSLHCHQYQNNWMPVQNIVLRFFLWSRTLPPRTTWSRSSQNNSYLSSPATSQCAFIFQGLLFFPCSMQVWSRKFQWLHLCSYRKSWSAWRVRISTKKSESAKPHTYTPPPAAYFWTIFIKTLL